MTEPANDLGGESVWPIRSMLFIPANKADWAAKAGRFAPDAVVLDLEDAVPPQERARARSQVPEMVASLCAQGIEPFVRINALGQGGEADIAGIVCAGLRGIVLPKARTTEEIRACDRLLAHAEGASGLALGTVALLPLPETPEGMADGRALAAASSRVRGLVTAIGGPVAADIARAFGFRPTLAGAEQHYLASKTILDSRAAGADYPMASIIGTALDDLDAVRMLITRARDFGFSGVLLIHPSHVPIADEIFSPTEEEVEFFTGMIDALEEAEREGKAAISYRGQMVDLAMRRVAKDVLRTAGRR